MNTTDKLAKEIKKQITSSDNRKPKPYDAQAEVLRVEDGVAWVHIPGGVDETPVRLTINAKKGDMVNIHVANGSAWITGNGTNPPTDDSTANYAVDLSTNVQKDVVVLNNIVAENIEATNARFGNVEADTAKIHNLEADEIHAGITYTNELIAEDVTTEKLTAASGYIEDLEAGNVTAQNLVADHATIEDLDATYAEIDFANVNVAWIEQGNIKKAEVFDENVFDLSGNRATLSRIDASKINVANLRADNLIVRRINGQPVVGGYTLIDSNSSGYPSKNPKALGWYEFVNAQWVLSTDTTVDMTKAYYQEGNEVSLYDQAYIDALENDLQQQIDGAVETFTGSVVPTLTNYPYTDWYNTSVTPVHDERAKHVGDIYYVVNSSSSQGGYCYRFTFDNTTHAYNWVLIKDSDVTKALSDISELQTFESETTSWIDETDEGLETIRTNHTALSGVVDKTVKESVQLWFTKANTTAPSKPTAEVTSTSTAGNAWRKVVPAWNASYPNYYYCWQYKFVDGTFGWSDVIRDIAMGETQGTARDAKNTADAALPASTFTTFESTTFKNVKDTVDEQTTKFTNMTTRLGLNSDGTGANTDIVAKESALEQTVDGISSRVGKTEMHLAGMYATSSTAAGTAAKVATIVPALSNYELVKGAMVTVKFTAANTAASPTLNLNSTGAKAIKTYSGGNLTEAEYKWKAGSTFTFTYNGTNWLMQDSTASVRMNSAETGISQNAEQIALRAKSSDVYTKGQVYTKTETDSAITTKAGEISLSVAQTEIGKIEVGGRNLFINSEFVGIPTTPVNNSNHWGGVNSSKIFTADIDGRTTLTATKGTSTGLYCQYTKLHYNAGETVEMSLTADIYVEEAGTVSIGGYIDSSGWKGIVKSQSGDRALSVGWNKLSVLLTLYHATYSGNVIICFTYTGATMYLYHPKLEKGNKATDWTPAPEDVAEEISETKASITLTNNSITSLVEGNTTYTKPDGTTGTSAIGTAIKQTQDNVLIKATKDGATAADKTAGGTSAIGLINVSPDNVKIAAKNVDITGTTTFSDGTSINSIAQAAADAVEVGGRNLLVGTGTSVSKETTATTSYVTQGLYNTPNMVTLSSLGFVADDEITLSFDWKVTSASTYGNARIEWYGKTSNSEMAYIAALISPFATFSASNTSGHVAKTVKLTSATIQSKRLVARIDNSNLTLTISNLKLEKGNKATDWTPAPEDVQADINAVDSKTDGANLQEQRIYYRSNSTTAPTAPSTWVTSTSTTNATWSTKRMQYDKTYKYLYTCIQRKTVGGTISNSTVLLDDTTTVIDGGNIITGTVTANKLNVANINASKTLTVGAMSDDAAATILNSEIEVGGKNLLLQSNNGANYVWTQNGGAATRVVDSEGATFTITSLPASGSWGVLLVSDSELKTKIVAGETYTLSFDLKTSDSISSLSIGFNIREGNAAHPHMKDYTAVVTTTANKWIHVTNTTTALDTLPSSSTSILYISAAQLKEALRSFSIKNVKVEKGNKATDWTPAPEDVQAEIDAKKSVHTLISSNASGSTYATILGYAKEGVSTNFTVTSTAGVKVGDTARIAYKVSDFTGTPEVYIVGTVTDVNNSTNVRITAHGLDTTIIDGGNILTNSIGANQIASNAITADKIAANAITIGDMDSSTASKVNNGDSALTKVNYYNRACQVGNSGSTQTAYWRKFASYTETGTWQDDYIIFDVSNNGDFAANKRFGKLKAHIRTEGTAGVVATSHVKLEWITRSEGISLGHFVLAYKATSGTDVKVELWAYCPDNYTGYRFGMVEEGKRAAIRTTPLWTLHDDWTSNGQNITSGYTQVVSTDIDAARTTATTYITDIDSDHGITIKPRDKTGNDYLQINSTDINFFRNAVSVAAMGDSELRIGRLANEHIRINSSGMAVYTGSESDSTNVASFGDSARVGKEASRHVAINSDSIDINNGSITSASFGDDIILGKDSSYKTIISSDELTMMDNNNDPSFSVTSVGNSRTETITTSPVAPNRTSATGKTMSTSLAKYSTTYTFRPISPIDGSIMSGSITYSFTANSAKSETRALSTTYGTISIQFIPQYKYTNNVRKVIKVQARITTTGASGKCIGVQKSYQTTVYPANMHFSGDNNLLWSADEAMYMISSHIIYLNELVSSQLTGIVVAWSAYVDSEMKNYDWIYSYVPKMHVITDEGHGVSMPMAVGPFTYIGSKYVYVYDDRIVGHENNNAHGSKNGVTYDNRHWIIRYVYGV